MSGWNSLSAPRLRTMNSHAIVPRPMADKFAIVETGGKQYLAHEGAVLRIEKLPGEHQVGGTVIFDKVILTNDGDTTSIGLPYVDGAKVEAEVTKIDRAKKVVVIKYKAKSNYFKKRGHRQPFFDIKITKLV